MKASIVLEPAAGGPVTLAATKPGKAIARSPLTNASLAVIGMAGFLLLWAGAAWWKASPIQLPGPWRVASALVDLAVDGELWANAWVSIQRVFIGLVISTLLAVPLGLWMGLNCRVERLVDPVVELLRPISGIAWIPLALFIFGVGEVLPVFILVYVASFQLLMATVAGVRSVDGRLLAAARTMGIRREAVVRKIVIPAALPYLMSGLRLAFAATWSAIVAAELIGAPSGVGFAIEWHRQLLATPKVFAFIVVIGTIGYVSDWLLRLLQERLAPVERQAAGQGAVARQTAGATGLARVLALGWSLLLPVLLLAAWQFWALTLPANSPAPSPVRVLQAFGQLTRSGDLPAALLQSLERVAAGFAIAFVLAVPIGIAMGRNRTLQGLLRPIVEGFRPIAPMAILPVAILWLGTGTPTAYAIVGYAAFFPLLLNTAASTARIDRRLLSAAATMGIPSRSVLLRVVLPAALPDILLGARMAMGVAWTAIIAAELAVGSASGGGASGGIGQMMFVFYAYSVDLNGIVVCMIVVGIVALLIDRLFRLAERRLTPWRSTNGR